MRPKQLPGETSKAYSAFLMFYELGPQRQTEAAWKAYAKRNGIKSKRPPTRFKKWIKDHDWRDRATAADAALIELEAQAGGDETKQSLSEARRAALLALPELMESAIAQAKMPDTGSHKMFLDLCALVGVKPSSNPGPLTVNAENAQINLDLTGLSVSELIDLAKETD